MFIYNFCIFVTKKSDLNTKKERKMVASLPELYKNERKRQTRCSIHNPNAAWMNTTEQTTATQQHFMWRLLHTSFAPRSERKPRSFETVIQKELTQATKHLLIKLNVFRQTSRLITMIKVWNVVFDIALLQNTLNFLNFSDGCLQKTNKTGKTFSSSFSDKNNQPP